MPSTAGIRKKCYFSGRIRDRKTILRGHKQPEDFKRPTQLMENGAFYAGPRGGGGDI